MGECFDRNPKPKNIYSVNNKIKIHMNNWKQLRRELRDTFGKDGFKYFNDKNKYTRRIKIYGNNKNKVREYLQFRYPNLTMWETTGGVYGGYFDGICFNVNH